MKRSRFLISALLFVATLFSSNGFAQDYVHYATLTKHSSAVYSIVFSPDGKTLVSGSGDKTIRLWDTDTGQHKKTLTGHTHWVNSVAFRPDGKTFASGSADKTIRLWDTDTGQHKKTFTGHTKLHSAKKSSVFSQAW